MMEVGKVLMVVAIVAVAIASFNLIGTINKLGDPVLFTPTEEGYARVEILESISILFTTGTLDWGSGNVIAPGPAILQSETGPYYDALTWAPASGDGPGDQIPAMAGNGLVLINEGTIDASVTLQSSDDATDFICGGTPCTSPSFQWLIEEAEALSCGGTGIPVGLDVFSEVTHLAPTLICPQLEWADQGLGADPNTLGIHIQLIVPLNAPSTLGADITATLTAVASVA